MIINFFEEFPDKDLNKAKLINFPTRIYIAAFSLKEFYNYKQQLKKINKHAEAAWWILTPESYYITSLAPKGELDSITEQIKHYTDPAILLDIEPWQAKNHKILNYFYNRKRIKSLQKILTENNVDIYTSEFITPFSGLSRKYPVKKIRMFYTSMLPGWIKPILQGIIKKGTYLGLGTIAIGILGTEPILSPEALDKDLSFAKKNEAPEVTIFRVGGLNKSYLSTIKKYL